LNFLRHIYRRRTQKVAIATLVLFASFLSIWPATASSDAKEEKRIEALEQQFFSQTYNSDSDDARLARVEDMLFNHTSSGTTGERLASLEDALSSIKSSAKTPSAKSSSTPTSNSSSGSSAGNNSRYRHFADMDDQDSDGDGFDSPASNFYNQATHGAPQTSPASPIGAKSGTLVTQQLAAMETQIFGKPNLKMPLVNRVKKLEQNVLSSGTDTSSMSLPDRIKNLWTNLNSPSATTGNGTKNRTPAATATEDAAPPTTTARKRPQTKAQDDDVSDDQAMAEYLQKLKKGTSVRANAASTSSTGKRSSRNSNKSGWLDESEMPSKGLDPDYSSDDDNPPIVVGGNSSMSNMQQQGSVQNFSSGMGMNMGVPNQNPGLFSKLGQAIGGAVSGGNSPYGYGGSSMYGGYPNGMPYGYGGMSPYGAGLPYGGMSPYGGYGGYGGLSPFGGYGMAPPVMGPSLGGIGSYGNVSPYGAGGPRPGNPYGINPYGASPQPFGVVRR
jgi:hypothetical protein